MTLKQLARYLFLFDREAILALSADRRAIWVGLAFVLSAGLAREYDAEYLLAEPWHLAIPLGASLVACLLLFLTLFFTGVITRPGRPPLPVLFVRFLALFWLTAPLAWLYAIPWERVLGVDESALANLGTLALVAAWRVLIMIRVGGVLFRWSWQRAVWPVLLFSCVLAFAALMALDVQILAIMGGVQLSAARRTMQQGALLVSMGSVLTTPLWFLGTVVVFTRTVRQRPPFEALPESASGSDRAPIYLAAGSLAVGLALLPLTQPEQARRHAIDEQWRAGNCDAAADLLCATPQDDFPPHWDPPPRRSRHYEGPEKTVADALAICAPLASRGDVPAWLVERYNRHVGILVSDVNSLAPDDPVPPRLDAVLNVLVAWPEPGPVQRLKYPRTLKALDEPENADLKALYRKALDRRNTGR